MEAIETDGNEEQMKSEPDLSKFEAPPRDPTPPVQEA